MADTRAYFNDVPNDVLLGAGGGEGQEASLKKYLPPDALRALASCDRRFYSLFDRHRLVVEKFLGHVVRGEEEQVLALLKKIPTYMLGRNSPA